MIYDKIENIGLYNIDMVAVDFIKSLSCDIECKKYFINDKIYANVEEYSTKDVGFFEAHRKYIDVQILLSGEEIIEYTSVKGLETKEEYDSSRDIEFFYDGENPVTEIKLESGLFTVLYPHEAHKPQMKSKTQQKVKKVVVKIPVV